MENNRKSTFLAALKTTSPMIAGFVPTGMAYALLCRAAGIKETEVLLSSLIVFAGSVQFITIELVKQGMDYFQYALIIFLIHSRHMFYGISVYDAFSKTGRAKPFMIFALTDELYALMTSTKLPKEVIEGLYYTLLAVILYVTWNVSTALGVFAYSLMTFNTSGMDFALTAMFLVIMIEQMKSFKSKLPFIIGGSAAIISSIAVGSKSMLLGCAVLSVISLLLARKYVESGAE